MIGPSGSVLISLGARFAGCIKYIANVSRKPTPQARRRL